MMIETRLNHRDRRVCALHEFIVMPDHLHLLLTPSSTTSVEKSMQFIKGGSSHQIHKARKQKMEIWQVGFHDWTIRDWNDWQTKVEYIHSNPVRAKLVQRAEDWQHSSARGKFSLDPIPEKFLQLSSGAEAQTASPLSQGLKPQPPKENGSIKCSHLRVNVTGS